MPILRTKEDELRMLAICIRNSEASQKDIERKLRAFGWSEARIRRYVAQREAQIRRWKEMLKRGEIPTEIRRQWISAGWIPGAKKKKPIRRPRRVIRKPVRRVIRRPKPRIVRPIIKKPQPKPKFKQAIIRAKQNLSSPLPQPKPTREFKVTVQAKKQKARFDIKKVAL
ncbi:TPA: hypothetical protein EYP13_02675, partial [Candidatus Micrarchaeota archaeon]|nr:hypothetical protein [Candidatus Micrarchaeota archaeon]